MDAIGNRSDGHFPNRQPRPKLLPHLLRYLAMETAHGIAKRRRLDGRYRHRERFLVVLRTEPAQSQEFVERNLALAAIPAEILVEQTRIEQIDAGGHPNGRRKYVVAAAGLRVFVTTPDL